MARILNLIPTILKCFPTKNYNILFRSLRHMETDVTKTVAKPDFTATSSRPPLPLITSRPLQYPEKYIKTRQAWVLNLDTVEEKKLGMIDLHPSVFAAMPRLDIMYRNLLWQKTYRRVQFKTEYSRAELSGGSRKPWPQKGTGRARHGSIRSPIFKGGGKAHGLRGPMSYFYMLPFTSRLQGLITTLSTKFAQDDLFIVDSLEIPTQDSKFIDELIEQRKWGVSVLFVNECDVMPRNITLATDKKECITLMPYYGLNVYSMLKYDTLVMTLEALNKIEERLLFGLNRSDTINLNRRFDKFRFNRSILANSGPVNQ